MEEYWEYIKWFGKSIYKEELELLGNEDVTCIFHDEFDCKILKNDIILITDCNSIQETVYKISKYQTKLEKYFKITDISLFKGNDSVNLSETYLISIYCVDKSKYKNNMEKYDRAFKMRLKNLNLIIKSVKEIYEQDIKKLVEVNDIPQGNNTEQINDLYVKLLNNIKRKNRKDLTELKYNRKKFLEHDEENNYNYELSKDKLLKNINVKYFDRILKMKANRNIKRCKIINKNFKKNKQKNLDGNFFNDKFSSIVIIDCEDDGKNKEYSSIFRKMNSKVIIISKNNNYYNNEIVVDSLNRVINMLDGCKILYISNDDKEFKNKNIIALNVNDIKDISYDNVINKITQKKEILPAFSNLDHINSVKVLTGTFFNFDGSNYYSGGAERYLIDLHEVCKQLGMKLRIYQKANYEFFRYYNDIEVVGISHNNEQYSYDYNQNIGILEKYNTIAKNKTKLNIYSAFLECYGNALSPSIGISHGVAWDYKKNEYTEDCFKDKSWIIEAAMSCDKLVSVDTNTANYFQTIDYKLGNTTEVIPNYVNNNEFVPNESKEDKSNIVILYPRRLYEARGLYILLDNVDKLLSEYSNIEIHFVGKGFKEDTDKIQDKIDKWGNNRVKMYNCPPNKMYEVYKKADISVIPTLFSEGTSLSCLEAMSTANAVIATRIGGLTDLVINNYNGKLIEPNKESLYMAIKDFLNNPELMKKCKKNAREVSKVFSKDIWINNWKRIIKNYSKKVGKQENVYYNITKIYVSSQNLQSKKLNKIIFEKLCDNNLVYIVNNDVDKKQSYGRLQYIKDDEDLYRNPNSILIDKDYENKENITGEYIDI